MLDGQRSLHRGVFLLELGLREMAEIVPELDPDSFEFARGLIQGVLRLELGNAELLETLLD